MSIYIYIDTGSYSLNSPKFQTIPIALPHKKDKTYKGESPVLVLYENP